MLRGPANYVKAGTIYDDRRLAQNSGRHRSSGFGNQCYPWRSQLGYKSRDRTPPASEDGPARDGPDRGAHEAATSPNELLKQQERAAKAEKELLELQERFKGKSFLQLE